MHLKLGDEKIIERIESAERAPNYLTMILRGHHGIEQLLNRGLELYTSKPNKGVLRLPFAVKVDLAETLGIIDPGSIPLFRSFNMIRNRFAHNPFARFTKKDARDMANCLSPAQKAVIRRGESNEVITELSNREFFWRTILAMMAELVVQIEGKVRSDVEFKLVMDKAVSVAARISRKPPPPDPKRQEEIEREVRKIVGFTN
jgi:hypothetical protein